MVVEYNKSEVPKKIGQFTVKEVRVTGDKALLNYTITLPPRGLIVEEMPVLSNVHFGGIIQIRSNIF